MRKTALARWDGDLRFVGLTGSGHEITMDAEEGDAGARPSELPLVGLAGCTAIDVVEILRKKRQVVTRYVVAVDADQREAHPKVFGDIVVEHRLEGESLDLTAVHRAIELSATRYCTVTAVIATGVARIIHRYFVKDDAGEHRGEVIVTGPGGANVANLPAMDQLPAGHYSGGGAGATSAGARGAGVGVVDALTSDPPGS
jgi:putative redox protein